MASLVACDVIHKGDSLAIGTACLKMLTNVLWGTKIQLHVAVPAAQWHNGLGVACAVHILAVRVGRLAQDLLGWQSSGVFGTEGTSTPATKTPPVRWNRTSGWVSLEPV